MDLAGEIRLRTDLSGGNDGFRQTTAATSGPLYYVTDDSGRQIVGRLSDGKTVPDADFPHDPANVGAPNGGVGQPAVSRGYVQFAGPEGVFVYRNRDDTPPEVELTGPPQDSTADGGFVVAATASRRARDRGGRVPRQRPLARLDDPDSGDPLAPGGASYSVAVDTTGMPAGEYVLDAIASDGTFETVSEPRRIVVPAEVGPGPDPARRGRAAVGLVHPPRRRRAPQREPEAGRHRRRRPRRRVGALPGRRARDLHRHHRALRVRLRLTADDVGRTTLVAIATDTAGQTGAALRGVTGQPLQLAARVSARTTPRARPPPAVPLHDQRRRADARRAHARAGLRDRRRRGRDQGGAEDDLHPPRRAHAHLRLPLERLVPLAQPLHQEREA